MGQFNDAVEDVRRFIVCKNVNATVTVHENQITLHRSSGATLEITCDDQEHYRLKEDLGNHPNGVQTQVTVQPPRWGGSEPPISQSDMLTKAKWWLASTHQT